MIYLIILIALSLRLTSINQSFWLDETIQAYWSNKPISQIPILQDFHPPFFYFFTHFWQTYKIFNEGFLRLPSVIFGVLTIWILYKFTKELFDKNVALTSSALLATSAYHIYYSQEYRVYSFFCLLVLASWYFLYNKKNIVWIILSILGVYTNYFYLLVLISQFFWIFKYKKESLKNYVNYFETIIFSFIFWIPTFLHQLKNAQNLMINFPKWKDLSGSSFIKFPGLLLAKFTVGMTSLDNKIIYAIIVTLVLIILLIAIYKIYKTKVNEKIGLFYCYFFISFIIALFSSLFTSANGPWRLLYIIPSFYVILSYGLLKYKNIYLKSLILIILFINLFFTFRYLGESKFKRENWREAIVYTDNKLNKNTIAINNFVEPFTPILWYSKKTEKYFGNTNLNIINNYQTIIYFNYLTSVFDTQNKTENFLIKNNYKIKEEKDFLGVGIIKIYQK